MNIVVEKRIIEELGIPVRFALLEEVSINTTSPDIEKLLEDTVVSLQKQWTGRNIPSDPLISGFYELHRRVGVIDTTLTPAPEWLVRFILRHKRFPRVNMAVDLYNLISATSGLALGAHDCRL